MCGPWKFLSRQPAVPFKLAKPGLGIVKSLFWQIVLRMVYIQQIVYLFFILLLIFY